MDILHDLSLVLALLTAPNDVRRTSLPKHHSHRANKNSIKIQISSTIALWLNYLLNCSFKKEANNPFDSLTVIIYNAVHACSVLVVALNSHVDVNAKNKTALLCKRTQELFDARRKRTRQRETRALLHYSYIILTSQFLFLYLSFLTSLLPLSAHHFFYFNLFRYAFANLISKRTSDQRSVETKKKCYSNQQHYWKSSSFLGHLRQRWGWLKHEGILYIYYLLITEENGSWGGGNRKTYVTAASSVFLSPF